MSTEMTTARTAEVALPAGRAAPTPRWLEFARRLRKSKGAMGGLGLLVLIVLGAIFASAIAPFDPIKVDSSQALYTPGTPHLFGTDELGRDVFSRVLYGGQISLIIGPIAVSIAVVAGVTAGLIAGYYRGWADTILMRIVDVMLAFPGILLALAIVSMLGPSVNTLMIAVGISSIPTYARLTRGSVLSARENLYVEAARVLGVPNPLILARHI